MELANSSHNCWTFVTNILFCFLGSLFSYITEKSMLVGVKAKFVDLETKIDDLEFKNSTVKAHLRKLDVSLHATSSSDRCEMKLRGKINGRDVLFLVDSGATLNFVSLKLMNALPHPTGQVMSVTMGNGTQAWTYGSCNGLEFSIGSVTFTADMHLFDIPDVDIILGFPWLASLGEVTHDWANLTMRFQREGSAIQFQGVSSSNDPAVSLTSIFKISYITEKSMLVGVKEKFVDLETKMDDLEFKNSTVKAHLQKLDVSLHATSSSDRCEIKLRGKINGRDVLFLVDSGATLNFVSLKLMDALPHPTGLAMSVTMGNGTQAWTYGSCNGLEFSIGSVTFAADMYLFDIPNVDIILGFPWLASLGEVSHDWANLTMRFQREGSAIQFQGFSSSNDPAASLTSIFKISYITEKSMLVGVEAKFVDLETKMDDLEFKNSTVKAHLRKLDVSLHATSSSDRCEMKLRGKINGRDVLFLVDSGATLNFVSLKLMDALPHPTGPAMSVTMGNGTQAWTYGSCNGLEFSIGSVTFAADMHLFDIPDVDIILGFPWLASLGEVTHDWANLTMCFQREGSTIQFQGVSSSNNPAASLTSIFKISDDEIYARHPWSIIGTPHLESQDSLLPSLYQTSMEK